MRVYGECTRGFLDASFGPPFGVWMMDRRGDEVVDSAGVDQAWMDLREVCDAAHPHGRLQLVFQDYREQYQRASYMRMVGPTPASARIKRLR